MAVLLCGRSGNSCVTLWWARKQRVQQKAGWPSILKPCPWRPTRASQTLCPVGFMASPNGATNWGPSNWIQTHELSGTFQIQTILPKILKRKCKLRILDSESDFQTPPCPLPTYPKRKKETNKKTQRLSVYKNSKYCSHEPFLSDNRKKIEAITVARQKPQHNDLIYM